MTDKQHDPWLEIHDSEISSVTLAARVEERLKARREQLGPVSRHFPTFQDQALDLAEGALADVNMRELLRQLQELPAPPTHAILAPSPATRLPLLGRLWQLVRSQTHELVLFYVNRHVAHQAQRNHLLSNALNQLNATIQAQKQEMERLEARLEALEAAFEQTDE